ncbi:MAG TPA: PEP-CTERM sorting domain-containing protein [Bryobacteraceae bacterium]|nr:PEP-CTERM sorting domain-containing protein [Bryobacteraceae bacterium]
MLYLFNGQPPDILYVSDVHAATPEPATWVSTLTAFGAAIVLKRRRV